MGSSKVNQAEMPGGAEAQPDWPRATQAIPSSMIRRRVGILVDQSELDVVDCGIVADSEIERRHLLGELCPLHIKQKVPVYPHRVQSFLFVGPVGPNELRTRIGQSAVKGRDSVTQRIVLITRFPLAYMSLDPALAECEPRQNDRGKQERVVELLIKLLVMPSGVPVASACKIRTHVGNRIDGQREIVVLARHQRDGSLARPIPGIR